MPTSSPVEKSAEKFFLKEKKSVLLFKKIIIKKINKWNVRSSVTNTGAWGTIGFAGLSSTGAPSGDATQSHAGKSVSH